MAKLEIFKGEVIQFMTPSGNTVSIREQTAEDDDILSRVSNGDMIHSLNEFVATIVVGSTYKNSKNDGTLSVEDVLNLPLKDKHYILLKSRLHSIGNEMVFKNACTNPKCGIEEEYTEDLSIFDTDLSLGEADNKGKDDNVVSRYPLMKDSGDYLKGVEFTLSSGQQIRFQYMNGHSERKILEATKTERISANTEMYVRNLEIFNDGEWVKLSSLNIFSKKQGTEIRKKILESDKQFTPLTEVKCPHCNTVDYIPVITIKDFFFPTEI